MGYYDYDEEPSYCYYEERVEPVNIVAEECTEKDVADVLMNLGLIQDRIPRLNCSMERLVFIHGDPNEVYSPAEIRFTEKIGNVLVFPDFYKNMIRGNMACRVIAVKLNSNGEDTIKTCVSFEKIIDKALDGFNIFFFIANDCVFFGCRLFDKKGKSDCTISIPITTQPVFEQFQEELSFHIDREDFIDFYNHFRHTLASVRLPEDDYERIMIKRRGFQMSYFEEIDSLGREIGLDVSREKERYWRQFERVYEVSFSEVLEDAEESLSFIKSNRINTYEMLFEADEIMRQAEKTETETERLSVQMLETPGYENTYDAEMSNLMDNPEEMIKLLKKRRGI